MMHSIVPSIALYLTILGLVGAPAHPLNLCFIGATLVDYHAYLVTASSVGFCVRTSGPVCLLSYTAERETG